MKCTCGAPSEVVETRQFSQGVRRTRLCYNNHKFVTRETLYEREPPLANKPVSVKRDRITKKEEVSIARAVRLSKVQEKQFKVIRLHLRNVPPEHIAIQVGIGRTSVYYILKEYKENGKLTEAFRNHQDNGT